MNKEINNFDIIREMLTFPDEDSYYFVQILRRKKDPGNSKYKKDSNIKSYYINSLEYFDRKKEEIINLCNFFNARATIRLNRRSYKKTAKEINVEVAKLLKDDSFKSVLKVAESVSGYTIGENVDKKWLIDIDVPYDKEYVNELSIKLNDIQPIGEKIKDIIPSVNGYHLVVIPFNKQVINKMDLGFVEKDIKKDSYTNLFIPSFKE